MDPLSIAAASFSIAGAIAKASVAIFQFSREAKDAADDLSRVDSELQALSAILDPLTRSLSKSLDVSEALARQLEGSLEGCSLVVIQIGDLIGKYRREGAWTRTKWVVAGRGDMEKLRESVEAYKMALSLGLHVVSMTLQENIKQDTGTLRTNARVMQQDVTTIKVNTDEILARVNSIRYSRRGSSAARVEQWVEEIEILTSYAETTYQGTIIDPDERYSRPPSRRVSEVGFDDVADPAAISPKEGTAWYTETTPQGGVVDLLEERDGPRNQWDSEVSPNKEEDSATVARAQGHTSGLPGIQEETEDAVFCRHSSPVSHGSKGEADNDNMPTKIPAGNGELDLVVTTDIGEGSAAVMWTTRDTPLYAITKWPGRAGGRVPTSVAHDIAGAPSSWGFQCTGNKLIQGLSFLGLLEIGGDRLEVRGDTFRDTHDVWVYFLSHLYDYVRQCISAKLGLEHPDWAAMAVEFHFTLPGLIRTARPSSVKRAIKNLKGVLREAGIGTEAQHYAMLGLTETEAIVKACPYEWVRDQPDTLLIKIGEADVALIEPPQAEEESNVSVTLAPTTEFNELFAKYIRPRLPRFSVVAMLDTAPATHPLADRLSEALGAEEVEVSHELPPVLPETGPYTAGALGLLLDRQAWMTEPRPRPGVQDLNGPILCVWLREPWAVLDMTQETYLSTLFPYCPGRVLAYKVPTRRRQRPRLTRLYFDLFFTFDSRWAPRSERMRPEDDPRLTRLCTIRSSVDADAFEDVVVGDKWYKRSRTTHVVKFYLCVFSMGPFKAGPQFRLFAGNEWSEDGVPRETEVTWYAEPPHFMLPSHRVWKGDDDTKEASSNPESDTDYRLEEHLRPNEHSLVTNRQLLKWPESPSLASAAWAPSSPAGSQRRTAK